MPSDFGIGSARVNGGHTPPVSSETSCQLSSPSRRDREFESPPGMSLRTSGPPAADVGAESRRQVVVPVWHEASGQRCRGKKSGIEPNRLGEAATVFRNLGRLSA